jgi:phosphodiesterase/alkaline phosphatase D-like protein
MHTPYSEGFRAGVRNQRESVLDFIRIHAEQNVEITAQDIADEINHQYKVDMENNLAEMRQGSWGQKK